MFGKAIETEDERAAVGLLYEQYRHLLFARANDILRDPQLAENAVQETFVRAIRNLHKFPHENCPQTRGYLVIICENVAKRMYTRRKQEQPTDEELAAEETDDDPMNIAVSRDSVRRIVDAMRRLPPIYRDCLLLKHVYGHDGAEICEMLGVGQEALKKRFTRARKMLKDVLRKEGLR